MNLITGLFFALSQTILYALIVPISKKASQQVPPFTVMTISMFVLFILSLFASIFFQGGISFKNEGFKAALPLLIAFGIINFFAFWFVLIAYKYFPVWQITMFGLLTPVVAGFFAYFILGEKVTINLFVGLSIMAVGLFVAIK